MKWIAYFAVALSFVYGVQATAGECDDIRKVYEESKTRFSNWKGNIEHSDYRSTFLLPNAWRCYVSKRGDGYRCTWFFSSEGEVDQAFQGILSGLATCKLDGVKVEKGTPRERTSTSQYTGNTSRTQTVDYTYKEWSDVKDDYKIWVEISVDKRISSSGRHQVTFQLENALIRK